MCVLCGTVPGVGPDGRVLFIQEADGPWPKFPYTVITRTNRQIVHEFRRLRRREHAAQAQGQAGHTHIKVSGSTATALDEMKAPVV